MPTLISYATTLLQTASFRVAPLLAQAAGAEGEEAERGYSFEVAIILLCVVLGLVIALKPSKRTVEFKKPGK